MRVLCLCLVAFLGFSCTKTSRWVKPVHPSQISSYPTRDNQFVILAVEDQGVSASQAKEAARKEAAQVTLDNGYRYFIIDTEDEIQVTKTPPDESSENPSFVYRELVMGKKVSGQEVYPAIRLLIDCFTQKPATINSIDAQTYLSQ